MTGCVDRLGERRHERVCVYTLRPYLCPIGSTFAPPSYTCPNPCAQSHGLGWCSPTRCLKVEGEEGRGRVLVP